MGHLEAVEHTESWAKVSARDKQTQYIRSDWTYIEAELSEIRPVVLPCGNGPVKSDSSVGIIYLCVSGRGGLFSFLREIF